LPQTQNVAEVAVLKKTWNNWIFNTSSGTKERTDSSYHI